MGRSTSSKAMRPPGRRIRAVSARKGCRASRFRRAKPQVMPSIEWSGREVERASPWMRGTSVREAASIPHDRSIPIAW